MEPLVSIIIPVYNAEKWIRQTIENLQEQTYSNFEIILVDDASTDKSASIIEEYLNEKIRLVKQKKNMGPAIARNEGIKLAKGRYICFQDADDLWEKDKLEKQLAFMRNGNYGFSYTAFEYANSEGTGNGKKVNVPFELTYKEALKNTRILTISVMFDTEKIDKSLILMPDVKSEDIATWWNILKKGYTAYGLNEVLVYYRRTPNTLTANKIKWPKNRWNLYRKNEGFSILKSSYYFMHYAINAIIKRI